VLARIGATWINYNTKRLANQDTPPYAALKAAAKERQREAGKEHGRGITKVVEQIPQAMTEKPATKTRDIRAKAAGTNRTYIDDIKSLISQEAIDALNFEEISYVDAQNRNQPAYLLDFDATMTLITAPNFGVSEYKDAKSDIKT